MSCVLRGIERGVRKLGLGGRRNLGLSIFWAGVRDVLEKKVWSGEISYEKMGVWAESRLWFRYLKGLALGLSLELA